MTINGKDALVLPIFSDPVLLEDSQPGMATRPIDVRTAARQALAQPTAMLFVDWGFDHGLPLGRPSLQLLAEGTHPLAEAAEPRHALVHDLRRALEQGHIDASLQTRAQSTPVVTLGTGAPTLQLVPVQSRDNTSVIAVWPTMSGSFLLAPDPTARVCMPLGALLDRAIQREHGLLVDGLTVPAERLVALWGSTSTGHHEHHQLDPQAELQLGIELIEAGAYEHAAKHLATAAGFDPANPGLTEAVRMICARVPEPLELVSLEGGGHVGKFVLRAMLEASVGQLTQAFCHLLQAEAYDPSLPYLEAVSLESISEVAWASVDPEAVGSRLSSLGSSIDQLDEPNRADALERVRSLLERLLPLHPDSEALTFAACILFRRMQAYDKAIDLAQSFLVHSRQPRILIALATALRDKGDLDQAIVAFEEAQALDPSQNGPSLDLGDMHGQAGRFQEAIDAYTFALELEPDNGWAQASVHYYRFLLNDEPHELAELAKLAHRGDNQRAQDLHQLVAASRANSPC